MIVNKQMLEYSFVKESEYSNTKRQYLFQSIHSEAKAKATYTLLFVYIHKSNL